MDLTGGRWKCEINSGAMGKLANAANFAEILARAGGICYGQAVIIIFVARCVRI